MRRDHKEEFLSEAAVEVEHLYLFDFDGTICFSGEFNEDELVDPVENKPITSKLKEMLSEGNDVGILTSRSKDSVVRKYLDTIGIVGDIPIHTVGKPRANDAKGAYIKRNFSDYDVVTLYDDNQEYLDSAKEILDETDIRFSPILVTDTRKAKPE